MDFQTIIRIITAIGLIAGALDLLTGKKIGISNKFTEAYGMAGKMFLSMAGIMCFAPVIAEVLRGPITAVCDRTGIDPSILGIILGMDMGGYRLAASLARNELAATMHGLISASFFGGTITFSLPLIAAVIAGTDFDDLATGIIIGMILIPVGNSIFGILIGLEPAAVLINNFPVIIISVVFSVMLWKFPDVTRKAATVFGNLISKLNIVCICIGSVFYLLNIRGICSFAPIMESMNIICGMIIVLSGMLPVMELFNRVIGRRLEKLGQKSGLDSVSITGLLFTLISCVPTISLVCKMNPRGKVLNGMWIVLNAATFGSQMSFVMSVIPEALLPFIVSKIVTGIIGIFVVMIWLKRNFSAEESEPASRTLTA